MRKKERKRYIKSQLCKLRIRIKTYVRSVFYFVLISEVTKKYKEIHHLRLVAIYNLLFSCLESVFIFNLIYLFFAHELFLNPLWMISFIYYMNYMCFNLYLNLFFFYIFVGWGHGIFYFFFWTFRSATLNYYNKSDPIRIHPSLKSRSFDFNINNKKKYKYKTVQVNHDFKTLPTITKSIIYLNKNFQIN